MITELVGSIKPIAKYIDRLTASGHRVIVLMPLPHHEYCRLVVDRTGEFGSLDEMDNFKAQPLVWREAILEDLLLALRKVLQEAERKKEGHLAAIRSRREMLDKVLEIMEQK
ncbi:MAG: hypothetical protein KBC81_00270 [Candidatus Pacebacteria bacterium]|nr:hypothetical protein [Candidatus Paceibacterota bacterium]